MNRFRVYGLTCVLMLSALAARATTIVMPTDEQLIAKSTVIVEGTVVSATPVDRNGTIWTAAVIEVSRNVRGTTPRVITVNEIGGLLGDRITRVFGTPEYVAGERVLLFLNPAPAGGYRTVDLFVGKFNEERTLDGRRLWARDDRESHVTLLDANFEPLPDSNVQRDAAGFERFVTDRLAGRAGERNYGVENPLLARDVQPRGRIASDFTLIDEPTVYRWFAFEKGSSVQWFSSGTQPGYTNGGASEIQTAIGAWVGYGQARIDYVYAGVESGAPGGLGRTNGVNEVLLNDPLNEIDGSWQRGTGGVVGRGGFNGVRSGGTWNAPFNADATHTAGPKQAWDIVEGNLTIQDNVSPANGINSNRLAEIISHEFGHTLGFGHSPDGSALMYASVSGLGPQLRTDDRLAARWLYPNGSTPPPPDPPTAPSNLVATPSGSAVSLQWNDNATTESGFNIYAAVGNGPFTKAGTAGANARFATVSGLSAGTFRFYVKAFNSSGESAASNTASATLGTQIQAAFSHTPQTGTAGVTNFTFYDESTGATSRQWSFGDGGTSSSAVATHQYASAGQYTVTLTAFGAGGAQSTATKVVSVGSGINADLSWTPANPTTNDTVAFRDESAGGVTSWAWTFGDGASSTQQNPTHRYNVPGSYNVGLTVRRGSESSSRTKSLIVTSPNPGTTPIVATFDVSTSTAVVGQSLTFTDRSTGNPTAWSWSFDDGGTSSAKNPSHTFNAAGTYTVRLTASNASTSGTAAKTITVTRDAQPFRSLISATAQTSGVGGSEWRTELTLVNAGTEGTSVQFVFVPGAGGSTLTRTRFLAPRQSATYENALLELFGLSSGAGALAIEATSATSTPALKITSRTFANTPQGTYGQAVPDVSNGVTEPLHIAGMLFNASYRTNVGLVNRGATPVTATLTLHQPNGQSVGSAVATIAPNQFQQAALTSYFPGLNSGAHASLTLRITPIGGALSAYASVVDNRTQDPFFIQGVPQRAVERILVPAIGRAAGANNTFWRSDVTLFNPGNNAMTVSLLFLRAGSDNMSRAPVDVVINSKQTRVLADVVKSLFGEDAATGGLVIGVPQSQTLVVNSRTYTTVAEGGTYGQAVDPVDSTTARELWIPGLRSDARFRTNIGLLNDGTSAVAVTLRLIATSGTEVATRTLSLAPRSQTQASVASLFSGVNAGSLGSFTLLVETNGGAAQLYAYGSVVDNLSSDPVCYVAE